MHSIKESFAASSSLSDISSLRSSWCFHKLLLFSHHFRHSSHFWVFFLIFWPSLETYFTLTVSWCFHKLLLFSHHFRHSSHLWRYLLPAISWQSYDLYVFHNFFKFLDQRIFCCEFIFKWHKFLEISLDARMFTKSLRLNSVSYRVKLWSVCLTQYL